MSEQPTTEDERATDPAPVPGGPDSPLTSEGAATDPAGGAPTATEAAPAQAPADEAVAPVNAEAGAVDAAPAVAEPVAAAEPATAEPAAATEPGTGGQAAPAAAPRPGPPAPRPGPPARPGPPRGAPAPTPAAVAPVVAPPSVVAASTVPQASPDPTRWGRVEPDGTIHLRTADGERVVGSWQAGTPEEGLAHFARRFDDLLTEVELLATRLAAGGGDPRQTLTAARGLRAGLDDAAVVGDVAALAARIDELVAHADEAVGAARSARDAQRAAAVARREELAAEAETLAAEATHWKQAGDRFTAILDEWRTIRGIDRKTDEALWKRFSRAREAFNRRRGSHFADLDRQRGAARARKEDLVVEAEKLATSDDWGPTATRFRDLMADWKGAGRAQKDTDDALWQRFRTAQDAFFARRADSFAERDAEFAANAEAKKALLAEAERIPTADPSAARAALRAVQERWEEIGKVPRDDIRPLEARLRAVEERVREAADTQWRRTDPEAEARVAQFRDRVAQFEAQAEKAAAAGDERRAAQARGQAEQWREWLVTAEQAVQPR